VAGASRCYGTHVRMRQWYSLCVYQLELQHAHRRSSTYKDINPARPMIELLGRYQHEQLYNGIYRRSRLLVSCVRSDQPPRYQDTQPVVVRATGGRLAWVYAPISPPQRMGLLGLLGNPNNSHQPKAPPEYGWTGQRSGSGLSDRPPATLGVFASLDRF
jgi:hypothetical protein